MNKQELKEWCVFRSKSLSEAKELYEKISKLDDTDIILYQQNYNVEYSHKEMLDVIAFIKE